MKKMFILNGSCYLLAAVLLLDGYNKIDDWFVYTNFVSDQLIPVWLNFFLIAILPFLQIGLGVFLLLNRTRRFPLMITTAMMISFTIYNVIEILRRVEFEPIEYGRAAQALGWKGHLILNFVLSVLAVKALIILSEERSGRNTEQALINHNMVD